MQVKLFNLVDRVYAIRIELQLVGDGLFSNEFSDGLPCAFLH